MTSSRIDLHVHSTVSDGLLTPTQVVGEAARRGLTLLSITDHDATDGLTEATQAARGTGLTFVPGVEMSVGSQAQEVHILGYFIQWHHPRLQEALALLRRGRDDRNAAIVEKLRSLGVSVDLRRVREIAGGEGSVGRLHIAAAMVEARHVPSLQEAFHRYLAKGKPAYVTRLRLETRECCELVAEAGGLPILAHPAKIASRSLREQLLASGVVGIEVYHCDHDQRDVEDLLALANERGLLITGGTDSHGPHPERPIPIGGVEIPDWVQEQFLARAPDWWKAAQ